VDIAAIQNEYENQPKQKVLYSIQISNPATASQTLLIEVWMVIIDSKHNQSPGWVDGWI
jgi:hypothetical protein